MQIKVVPWSGLVYCCGVSGFVSLFVGNPTTTDRLYIYSIFVAIAFIVPGTLAFRHIGEISELAKALGLAIYATWLLIMAVSVFVTMRDKRTLIQNKRFPNGLYVRGIRIPQGVASNAVWLLFPLVLGLWAGIGYASIRYGPVYVIECVFTDLQCF